MTSPPLDYLREIAAPAARSAAIVGPTQYASDQVRFAAAFTPEVCLALLADNARKDKALEEAERELAFAVEHMGRKGGGYERALTSVRQALSGANHAER